MSSKHSKACCTVPPVVAEDYQPKGKYETIGGMKTYVVGPSDAETAIFTFYDIFGLSPQIVQGQDILAYSNKDSPYQVFMPDFWDGDIAKMEWFMPPETAEKGAEMGKFFEKIAPPKYLPLIPDLVTGAEKFNPNIKKWGTIGYCWGGKMVALQLGADSKFKVGVSTSPAFIDPSDAEKVDGPFCMIASNGEAPDDVKKFEAGLKGTKNIVTIDQPHGFMSARADFKDEGITADYVKGYQIAGDFFQQNL